MYKNIWFLQDDELGEDSLCEDFFYSSYLFLPVSFPISYTLIFLKNHFQYTKKWINYTYLTL